MKLPWKTMRKCCFCNKKGNLYFINDITIYGNISSLKYAYHIACLENVMENPEKYGHRETDLAITITDLIKEKQNKEENYYQEYKQKQEILRTEYKKIPWWILEKYKKT